MLDGLRSKLAKGFELRVEQLEVHRGEQIEVIVAVAEPDAMQELHAGLICTEHYAYDAAMQEHGHSMASEFAHQEWQTVDRVVGEHRLRWTIPPRGPYSYAGEYVKYTWEVVARARRDLALDRRASQEICVRP